MVWAPPGARIWSECPSLISAFTTFLLVIQNNGPVARFLRNFTDQTFKGLYHPDKFDLMLLIPYFTVLVILASYGVHRYQLVWMYYKNRKNKVTEPPARISQRICPASPYSFLFTTSSSSSIAWSTRSARSDYPKEKLDIQVLDDSTDETVQVASAVVDRYAAMGYPSAITIATIAKDSRLVRSTKD